MTAPSSHHDKRNPEEPQRNNEAIGFLSILVLLLGYKDGLSAIAKPFNQCHCLGDVLYALRDMDNTQFIGVIGWAAILATSTLAFFYAIFRVLQRKK